MSCELLQNDLKFFLNAYELLVNFLSTYYKPPMNFFTTNELLVNLTPIDSYKHLITF